MPDYTDTHDFGDWSHASEQDPNLCIYCDMTKEQAAQTICPEYDDDEVRE